MLTASQVETVAFITDGGIICRDCAIRRFGEMGVAAMEEGIAEFLPQDVSPLIRYELDTLIGENASEYATETVGPWPSSVLHMSQAEEALADEWQEAFDSYPDEYPCDNCGEGIS